MIGVWAYLAGIFVTGLLVYKFVPSDKREQGK